MRSHEEVYEEEKSKPLKISFLRREEKEHLLLTWFTIDGLCDEPIPSILVRKRVRPSSKLVLFLHGLGGRKEDVFYLRELIDDFDFSLISIDARRHGDRRSASSGISANMVEDMSRTIVDNRLALDMALREGWAEEGKIILAGASMGGILGGVVAAVDKRIAGAVLYVPGGNLVEIVKKSKHPAVSQIRGKIPPFVINVLGGQLATVDPINYIDRISPRPLLIQLGRHDEYVPFETGIALFEKAKEPKQLVVHDSGHEIPFDVAMLETKNWISKNFPSLMSNF